MKLKYSMATITLGICCFFVSCGKNPIDRQQLSVSILPLHYFVSEIAGKTYHINVMIPPGQSPATYEPTSQQMVAISKSALYFRIGHIPFEKAHMDELHTLNPEMRIVDTSQGVHLLRQSSHHHDNDNDNEHATTGIDPHIWLAPSAARIICNNIYQSLCETDPAHCRQYEKNYTILKEKIEKLDREIRSLLLKNKHKKFIVFHPAWTYFAHEYQLEQIPIELEGKSPGSAHIQKIITIAKRENIKVIFAQKQFAANDAEAIAKAINGKVVKLDPLALNWLDNMKKIAYAFNKELQ